MQDAADASGPGAPPVIAVGFSPPDALAGLADHLGWRGRFLADEDRRLYRVLGLGRAPWWRVWSPGTIAIYARAISRGQRPRPPRDDTRQLGGDALVRDGAVVARWSPRSPDDRIPASELVAAARALAGS